MANTYVNITIDGIPAYCDVYYEPYVPANMSGHPDNWTPAEGGEIELETVFVVRKGKAVIDGKWVDCEKVEIDILPLLADETIERITELCYESLNSDQD